MSETTKLPLKRGQPSTYTEERADILCEHLVAGKTLDDIGKIPGMPGKRTINDWLTDNVGQFRVKYAVARELQGEWMADRALQSAITAEDAQLGRLAFDAYKWRAEAQAPKVWGKRDRHEITGKDGDALVLAHESPLELARRVAFLLAQGSAEKLTIEGEKT